MKTAIILFSVVVALAGCKSWQRSQGGVEVSPAGVKVENPANAEHPAQIKTEEAKTVGTVEAGTKAEVPVEIGGKPAVFSIVFPKIEFVSTGSKTEAQASNPRQPDKSVELKREANRARAPLLYAAIGMALVGGILRSLVSAWPSLAHGFWIGAALAAAAWKFDEVPWWACLLAVAAALLVIAGYKRAEWDANGNFIPDSLEKK